METIELNEILKLLRISYIDGSDGYSKDYVRGHNSCLDEVSLYLNKECSKTLKNKSNENS
jgi:hypothetical protein